MTHLYTLNCQNLYGAYNTTYSKLNKRHHIFLLICHAYWNIKAYGKRKTKHLTHSHYQQIPEIDDYLQR